MDTFRLVVGAGVVISIAASAFAIGPENYPTLGSMGSGGPSVTRYFDVSALATTRETDFVGSVANSNAAGVAFDGLVVRVTAKEPTEQTTRLPKMVKTTLARGEETSNQEVGPSAVAYGESTRHESFPGGPLKVNESVGLWVDLEELGREDVWVTVTPLVADKPKDSKKFASTLDAFVIESMQPSATQESESAELDRIAFTVRNHDAREPISALDGRIVAGAGVTVELTAVHVQDSANESRPIPGAVVVVRGNKFTVSGLSLSPAQQCEIVGVFSGDFDGHEIKAVVTGTFDSAK